MTEWHNTHESTVIPSIVLKAQEKIQPIKVWEVMRFTFPWSCCSVMWVPSFQAPLAACADSVQRGKSLGFIRHPFFGARNKSVKHISKLVVQLPSNAIPKSSCKIGTIVWSQPGIYLVWEFPVSIEKRVVPFWTSFTGRMQDLQLAWVIQPLVQISVILHPHECALLWSDHVLFPSISCPFLETPESLVVILAMLSLRLLAVEWDVQHTVHVPLLQVATCFFGSLTRPEKKHTEEY